MNLTVVVTNFGRANLLRRCLDSVIAAGCSKIVVSSMCPGPAEMKVINDTAYRPDLHCRAVVLDRDLGVNELWLRGLYYADTPYVLILHDDDYLSPEFGQAWRNVLEEQMEGDHTGLVSWRGSLDQDGKITETRYIDGPTRALGTSVLTQILLSPEKGPVSPVVSVFRRSDAIRFLKEASAKNRHPGQFTRPTMMLGNELLLYLRVAEKHRRWFYLDKALTFYGTHPESETVKNSTKDNWPKFLEAYNITRAQFKHSRALTFKPASKILHVQSLFEPSDAETIRRINFAQDTWKRLYATGEVLPFPVVDSMLARSSKSEFGDTRTAPFLKDLFEWGCTFAQPEDLIVFTNSDTCAVPSTARALQHHFSDPAYGADFAWRHNFFGSVNSPLDWCDHGFKDGGVDLVVLRPDWWRAHRDYMPDMLVACEAWDWILRMLIAEAQPSLATGLDGVIYHEYHEPPNKKPGFRTTNPGQLHNIHLARDFFASRSEKVQNIG